MMLTEPKCYFIKFEEEEHFNLAFERLNAICDIALPSGNNTITIKVNLNLTELGQLLLSIHFMPFLIQEINDISVDDSRTDIEKMNDILDIIAKYGVDNITMEDKLFLDNFSKEL